jgi:hypothetical protein
MKKDNKALIIETLNPKLKAKLLLLLIMNKWEEWEVNKPYLRVRRGKRKRRRDSLFVCLFSDNVWRDEKRNEKGLVCVICCSIYRMRMEGHSFDILVAA